MWAYACRCSCVCVGFSPSLWVFFPPLCVSLLPFRSRSHSLPLSLSLSVRLHINLSARSFFFAQLSKLYTFFSIFLLLPGIDRRPSNATPKSKSLLIASPPRPHPPASFLRLPDRRAGVEYTNNINQNKKKRTTWTGKIEATRKCIARRIYQFCRPHEICPIVFTS